MDILICNIYHTLMAFYVFFFNVTATTEIYTLSLHDALPILQTRPGGIHHHRTGLGQGGQYVFRLARDEPHWTRDFAPPRPVDRLLVRVHADHLRPPLRQRDGGVPDSSIQIPHHRTAHVAQLLDCPAARDRTHLRVDPLERGRGESRGRARDHARGAIHGLPPANHVCAVGERRAQRLRVQPRLTARFRDDVPPALSVQAEDQLREPRGKEFEPRPQLSP